jgi:hypothetical protein
MDDEIEYSPLELGRVTVAGEPIDTGSSVI